MLELSGVQGIVVLGVNPRFVYEGACAGRHAVVLCSSSSTSLPPWASGFLDVRSGGAVTIVDPSEPAPSRMSMELSRLAAAFDAAGREGLVIHPSAGQPASRRQA